MWVPRTLCSVKSRGDVGCWPAANLGQVHSNKFQWQLLLPEPCQSCLHMVGGSVALVFRRAWDFRALNFTGFWIFFNVCEGIKERKKAQPRMNLWGEKRRCPWVYWAEQGPQAVVCLSAFLSLPTDFFFNSFFFFTPVLVMAFNHSVCFESLKQALLLRLQWQKSCS